MCGDSGVGKTNVLSRYTRNVFSINAMSTIGAEFVSRSVPFEIKDASGVAKQAQLKLQLWDTAGMYFGVGTLRSTSFHQVSIFSSIYDLIITININLINFDDFCT